MNALGELVDPTPYEELAVEYAEVEDELRKAEARLPNVESEYDVRKIAVVALADKITEVMPWCQEVADKRVETRFTDINLDNRETLGKRLSELTIAMGGLALVYEVIGQPWPAPRATYTEEPEILSPDLAEDEFTEPVLTSHALVVDGIKEFSSRHKDAPRASSFIAYYLTENPDKSITADELADFIYSHVDEEDKPAYPLRNRITTILGPKLQGKRMARMLAEEGYVLQYGWQRQLQPATNGRPGMKISRRRVYRAVRMDEIDGELPIYREDVILAA
jgi:hypothetical protein